MMFLRKDITLTRNRVIVIVIFIWWIPFIPSKNLDEVFTYNHLWL